MQEIGQGSTLLVLKSMLTQRTVTIMQISGNFTNTSVHYITMSVHEKKVLVLYVEPLSRFEVWTAIADLFIVGQIKTDPTLAEFFREVCKYSDVYVLYTYCMSGQVSLFV